jgi:hypothetical protein
MERPAPANAGYLGGIGLLLVVQLPSFAAARPAAPPSPGEMCRSAIGAAEVAERIPPGLLLAIAMVESGRRDPATGAPTPWPWTINAEGEGRFFATREDAVAELQRMRARGVQVVDVGCMQVNLYHHPIAFRSVQEAFDPVDNARYAARFLKQLQRASGNWGTAVGRYHSSTRDLAEPYRARVAAAWPDGPQSLQAESRAEQLAEAWSQARPAGRRSRGGPVSSGRPPAFQSPVDQMALAWSRARPPAKRQGVDMQAWAIALGQPRPAGNGRRGTALAMR